MDFCLTEQACLPERKEMSVRLKSLCHYCGEEGYRRCSICSEVFCEKHCQCYEKHHEGLYYCHLSLRICVLCQKELHQLDPGELLARVEVNHIRIVP